MPPPPNPGAAVRRVLPVLAGAAAALLLAASCRPPYDAPPVTPQLARMSDAPVARLARGFRVYQESCARCHPYENPADHDVTLLTRKIIPEMARKAKLSPADEQALTQYLLAARKPP